MDTAKQNVDEPAEPQSPLYRYTATVWVARTYTIVAEDDESLEDGVQDSLIADGLDPEEFSLVRLQHTRTPIQWQ